jgi:hypothetical protein
MDGCVNRAGSPAVSLGDESSGSQALGSATSDNARRAVARDTGPHLAAPAPYTPDVTLVPFSIPSYI